METGVKGAGEGGGEEREQMEGEINGCPTADSKGSGRGVGN